MGTSGIDGLNLEGSHETIHFRPLSGRGRCG